MSDYDSPWKEALDHYFQLFLAFFFPETHHAIDWTHDCEALDPELRKLAPEGEVGRRLADKLVKVVSLDNGGDVVYLHVEVQTQQEAEFERRIHVYNYRVEDRYNQPAVSLVVLGDDNPDWRPHEYVFARWGCSKVFTFPSVKLLDYASQAAALETDPNPFALLVLTHLQARATRQDALTRAGWKTRLIKGLYGRGLDGEDVRHWYRFIDWLLDLPVELERQVWQEVFRFEEERRMPFITNAERFGMEKGLAQGLEKGLLQGIELALELKFGAEGLQLLPAVRQQTDPGALQTFLQSIRTATTLDDLRRLLP